MKKRFWVYTLNVIELPVALTAAAAISVGLRAQLGDVAALVFLPAYALIRWSLWRLKKKFAANVIEYPPPAAR